MHLLKGVGMNRNQLLEQSDREIAEHESRPAVELNWIERLRKCIRHYLSERSGRLIVAEYNRAWRDRLPR